MIPRSSKQEALKKVVSKISILSSVLKIRQEAITPNRLALTQEDEDNVQAERSGTPKSQRQQNQRPTRKIIDAKNQNGEREPLDQGFSQDDYQNVSFKPSREKLEDLVLKSAPLMVASAVFPFDLFPNQLSIERTKVNVIYNYFFFSKRIHSILIRDISDVLIETDPFFATLKIFDRGFVENSVNIGFMKKSEAVKIRRIIQGLMGATLKGISLDKLDNKELIANLDELGKAKNIE